MPKYKAGAIFLGPHDGVYILLESSKVGSTWMWSVFCSKLENKDDKWGIIERWRNEYDIDKLIENGILTPVVDADGHQE